MDIEEQLIENSRAVYGHFGYWPDFHDSEVIYIHFERDNPISSAKVSFRVYAFEMTNKVVHGKFKLVKHCYVDFELVDLDESDLDGFNHQNALSGIAFSQDEEWVACELIPAYGVGARFTCKTVRVKHLEPLPRDRA